MMTPHGNSLLKAATSQVKSKINFVAIYIFPEKYSQIFFFFNFEFFWPHLDSDFSLVAF